MTATAPAMPSRVLGRYLVGRPIGAGGMATVHAAVQLGAGGAGRVVALKLLHHGTNEFRASFHREAVIATRLEHANIVRTYEAGELGDELFIAMELVIGAPLSQLRALVPPIALAARIIADVLRGLHAAHELQNQDGLPLDLVHQDLTPQNVLVGDDGITKILDFGVARLNAVDTSRTDTVRGKPSYLAPEQLEGMRIDRRVDVFAVGTVFFELLTGARLFTRDTVALTYQAVLAAEIPDPRTLRPELTRPIVDVLFRALARSVDERFASAEEMRLALADACRQSEIEDASNEDVRTWVAQYHPPAFVRSELEREILDGVAERITELPPTVPEDARRAPTMLWQATRTKQIVGMASLVILLVALVMLLLQRR